MAEFFVSGPLHAEKELLREIKEVFPFFLNSDGTLGGAQFDVLDVVPGGVLLETELIFGLQLNHWLKTANRVLLRLSKFKAKDWPSLQKKLKAVDLKSWLGAESFFIQIDAEKCRLSNEKFLRKKVSEVWKIDENAAQKFFLRGVNDDWTLSLDTTGEHLHRRGIRKLIGEAPIRENLAALTLRILSEGYSRSKLSEVLLVDPMAGSGTFLIEARDLYLPSTSRSFSFQSWNRTPSLLKSKGLWTNYPKSMLHFPTFPNQLAIEIQAQAFDLLGKYNLPSVHGDFSKVDLSRFQSNSNQPIWFVSNPPYGRRIEGLSWMKDFWTWVKHNKISRGAIWIPRDLKEKFLAEAPQPPIREFRSINGGVPCEVLLFELVP